MSAEIIARTFEGKECRLLTTAGGPWFVHTDVCNILDISQPHRAADRLDDDEKGRHTVTTLGGPQSVTVISESGLWSLVLTSRKPEAKRFKKWLTSEVIPAIRKTGAYVAGNPGDNAMDLAARADAAVRDALQRFEAQVDVLGTKARAYDRLTNAEGLHSLTEAAKECGCPRDRFLAVLHAHGWIYRSAGKKRWLGHAAKERAGLVSHKTCEVRDADGRLHSKAQVLITASGLAKAATLPGISGGV